MIPHGLWENLRQTSRQREWLGFNNLARQVIHESHLHSTKNEWITSIASQLIQTAMRRSYIEKIKIQRQQLLLWTYTNKQTVFNEYTSCVNEQKRIAPRNLKLNRNSVGLFKALRLMFNNVRTTITIQTSILPLTCIRAKKTTIIPYQFLIQVSPIGHACTHSCLCQNIYASNWRTSFNAFKCFVLQINQKRFFAFPPDNFLSSVSNL